MKKLQKQQEYEDKYSKIIVTYGDNETKEFTPSNWFIFEDRVTEIAKRIEYFDLEDKPINQEYKYGTWAVAIWIVILILFIVIASYIF